jgi:hypothetical protein
MYSIVLLIAVCFIRLPHQDNDRSRTAKDRVGGSFVCLPCCIEARETIEEGCFINDNLVAHDVPSPKAAPWLQGPAVGARTKGLKDA